MDLNFDIITDIIPFTVKKLKKRHILLLSPFVILLLIVVIPFTIYDYFLNEDRDYALNKEMFSLAHPLDAYKKQHSAYPSSILEVRNSDNLCVTYIYPKCQKVYYKPINNKQDFRLALHSFTWVVLWYRPGACIDSNQRQLSQQESQQLQEKYGTYYYFCAASPEGSKPVSNASLPIYREDKKIFDNPNEWPVL